QLMAALNVSLAIINLFPIPVLDGGHLLFLLIEKIRKKTLSEKTEEFVTRLGLGLIGILVIFVFYNDTIKYGPEMLNKLLGKNKSQVSGIQESK
ncbi:MAG: site-2 protease family protein, partial [Candidatus Omnitrophota bacterium]